MGLGMIGPTLAVCGTPEQLQRYLPKLLSGEHIWCQGYSEPGSGSDLASLQCRAERDGENFVVNGTKIWTSYAHHANHIFCLVRTEKSGKPQQGITFLLIDMATPGVSVTPIVTLAGDHEVNQVFFDNVNVPVANIVGAENEGWTVAKTLLTFERSSAYAARLMTRLAELQPLVAAADEAALTMRFHDLEVRAKAIEMTEFRIQATLAAGQSPGAASSQMKILATEITQALDEVSMEALGHHCVPWQVTAREPGSNVQPISEPAAPKLVADYFNNRAATIYGGSNEVQRNILAKAELGL
jgi:acyl-CoA dehydrogenase